MSDPQDRFDSFPELTAKQYSEVGFTEEFANIVANSMTEEDRDEADLMAFGYNTVYISIQRLRGLIIKKAEEQPDFINSDLTYDFDNMDVDMAEYLDLATSPLGVLNMSDLTVPYFILCNEMVNRLVRVLFASEIIDEEYIEKDGINQLINELSNRQMEQTLYKSGVIEEDLHKKIVRVNNLRNDVAHNPFISLGTGSIEDIHDDVQHGVDAINGLSEALYGFAIYTSITEGDN
mgnify:CR=1 FL=1